MDQNEIISQFLSYMAENNYAGASDIIVDGKIHRFTVDGDKRGSDSGWYILFNDDIPAGAFGSWKTGEKLTWTAKIDRKLSPDEKKQLEKSWGETKKQREIEQIAVWDRAAKSSASIWLSAKPATNAHAYLDRKFIKPFGTKLTDTGDLIVPLRNSSGQITSLQFIKPDGSKKFLPGGKIDGSYFTIANTKPEPNDTLLIVEGFATGATVHTATDLPVIIAFSTGNLDPVSKAIRAKFPDATIIICADNDCNTLKPVENPGIHYATDAAKKINARVVYPVFEQPTKLTDFNDLAVTAGLNAVREIILSKPDPVIEPVQNLPAVEVKTKKTLEDAFLSIISTPFPKGVSLQSQIISDELSQFILFDEYKQKWYFYQKPIWRAVPEGHILRIIAKILDHTITGYGRDAISSHIYFQKFRLGRSPAIGRNEAVLDNWNSDKNLLPLQNGILDLRTMELIEHSPDFMFNWVLPYDYKSDAECPEFHSLIDWIADGNESTKHTLYAFLAAIVRGRADLQKYLELVGMPGTGKSSFMQVAKALVGNENTISSTMKEIGTNRFETAGFYGKRLGLFTDAKDWASGSDVFKSLTGQDPIRYEEKNMQQTQPFIFGGMIIVGANRPVSFDDQSTALVRRRISVHIDKKLDPSRKKDGYIEKLMAEMPGILNYVLTYSNERLSEILNDRSNQRYESSIRALIDTNPIAEWLEDNCKLEPNYETPIGLVERENGQVKNIEHLYPNYCAWSEAVGKRNPISLKNFSKSVLEITTQFNMPVTLLRKKSGVKFKGLALRSQTYELQPRMLSQVVDEP